MVLATAGCVAAVGPDSTSGEHARIDIGGGVGLTLPARPSYPSEAHFSQLITTSRDGQVNRVQAELDMSADSVTAVFSLPGGPPALSIHWTEAGMEIKRETAIPVALDARRILADVFLTYWPVAIIQEHLSDAAQIAQVGRRRLVRSTARTIVDISFEGTEDRKKIVLHNLAQGYRLAIVSRLAVSH